MEKYKTISEDIENVSNRDVVKHSRISGIGVGMIVAAVVCAIAGKSFEDPNSSLPAFSLLCLLYCCWRGLLRCLWGVLVILLSLQKAGCNRLPFILMFMRVLLCKIV